MGRKQDKQACSFFYPWRCSQFPWRWWCRHPSSRFSSHLSCFQVHESPWQRVLQVVKVFPKPNIIKILSLKSSYSGLLEKLNFVGHGAIFPEECLDMNFIRQTLILFLLFWTSVDMKTNFFVNLQNFPSINSSLKILPSRHRFFEIYHTAIVLMLSFLPTRSKWDVNFSLIRPFYDINYHRTKQLVFILKKP